MSKVEKTETEAIMLSLESVLTDEEKSAELGKPIVDVDNIAIKLNLPVETVSKVTKAVLDVSAKNVLEKAHEQDGAPTEQILRKHLSVLASAIQTADYEYQSKPNSDNAYSLTALLNTAQGALKTLKELCETEATIDRMVRIVIRPYTKSLLKVLISHLRNLRENVTSRLGGRVRDDVHEEFDDCIRKIGGACSSEYDKSLDEVRRVLEKSSRK